MDEYATFVLMSSKPLAGPDGSPCIPKVSGPRFPQRSRRDDPALRGRLLPLGRGLDRGARALPLPLLLRTRNGSHALDHQLGDLPALGKVNSVILEMQIL